MPQVGAALIAAAKWYAAQHVLVQVAIQVAVSAVTSAITAELAAQNAPTPQGSVIRLSVSSDHPRRCQIGKRANGGVLVDTMSRGYNNQWATMIIYLGEGPQGNLTGIWNGGRKVFTGTMLHGVKTELTAFRSPDARCWVTYYDGRPGQTVDPATNSEYPSRWPTTSRGTGCAYVVVSMRWDPDTMPTFPTLMFETEGAKFYDRRKDSTAGGSGTHRLKEPNTWEISDNPVVALDHFLLGRYLSASDAEPVFGIGLDANTVPYDRFLALANLADEDVNLKAGGTHKRYRANGFMFASDTYKDTILDLCRACNIRPADFGGKVSFIDNEAKASVVTLTDDDLAGNIPETYKPKKTRGGLIGGAMGTYQDVANNYAPVPYPEVTDASYATMDGERLENGQFDLEMETNSERAQRVATLWLNRQRRQAILSGVYTTKALKLEDGDWFTRAGNKFGAGKVFEVIGSPVINPKSLTVAITAREVDPTDSAWNELNATDPNIPDTNDYIPFQLNRPTVTAVAVAYVLPAAGNVTLPAIRFTNTDYNGEQPTEIEIEVAEDDTAGGPTGDVIPFLLGRGQQNGLLQAILPNVAYVWRYRSRLATNVSDWSSWSGVTAPNGLVMGTDDWNNLINVPGELKDGRVSAGLASNGDVQRVIPGTIKLSSDILSRSGGGTYTGDLAATIGAVTGLNLFGDNGTDQLTELLIRTGVGVSANFQNAGGFSTANHFYQATNPGAQPDGSIWSDTAENLIKMWQNGQWNIIGDLNAGGGVSVSPSVASASGDGTAQTLTTNSVTIDIGGYGSATYAWNDNGTGITIDSPTAGTTTFSKAMAAGEQDLGNTIYCDVTVNTGAVFQVAVQVDLDNATATVSMVDRLGISGVNEFGPNGGSGVGGFRVTPTGSIDFYEANSSGGYVADQFWISPPTAAPDDYEVRVTQVSGDAPTSGSALNTWFPVSTTRAWFWTFSDPDPGSFGLNPGLTARVKVEIRKGSGAVLDSADIDISVNTT